MTSIELIKKYNSFLNQESYETFPLERGEGVLNNYKLENGLTLTIIDRIPYNFLKSSYTIAFVDINIPITNKIIQKVSQYHCVMEEGMYSEDGYGYPQISEYDYIVPTGLLGSKVDTQGLDILFEIFKLAYDTEFLKMINLISIK